MSATILISLNVSTKINQFLSSALLFGITTLYSRFSGSCVLQTSDHLLFFFLSIFKLFHKKIGCRDSAHSNGCQGDFITILTFALMSDAIVLDEDLDITVLSKFS